MENKLSKFLPFILPLLFAIITVCTMMYNASISKIREKEYSNDSYSIKYDTTWKVTDKKELSLEHRKSKSTFNIVVKELESNYYDTKLKDIIKDIIYDVESQNEEFKLINIEENISDKYEGFSYLYEKGNEQVLVNIYKKDNKLILAYYSASNEYFDIVLDSVDNMFNSLEIKSGLDN